MKKNLIVVVSTLICFMLVACNTKKNETQVTASHYKVFGKSYYVLKTNKNYKEKGLASWYGPHFNHRRTSSGERYNMYKMTAAHKSLPLHSRVLVTNLDNGRKVVLTVNDRGPFVSNRLIDVSYGAAKQLKMVGQGLAHVEVKVLA